LGINETILIKRLELLYGATIRIISGNCSGYSPYDAHRSGLRIISNVI